MTTTRVPPRTPTQEPPALGVRVRGGRVNRFPVAQWARGQTSPRPTTNDGNDDERRRRAARAPFFVPATTTTDLGHDERGAAEVDARARAAAPREAEPHAEHAAPERARRRERREQRGFARGGEPRGLRAQQRDVRAQLGGEEARPCRSEC